MLRYCVSKDIWPLVVGGPMLLSNGQNVHHCLHNFSLCIETSVLTNRIHVNLIEPHSGSYCSSCRHCIYRVLRAFFSLHIKVHICLVYIFL